MVLGSVYPHNQYKEVHYELLMQLYSHQCQWGFPVIDFLSATDDGCGRWREGMWKDSGHPNQTGHRAMFKAVDVGLLIGLLHNRE